MIYSNITDWRAYALARGDSAPTDASDTDANAALQRASDYVRTRYALRYKLAATDERVIEATHMAAAYDIATPGFWARTYTPSEQRTLTRVGDIQWTPVEQMSSSGVSGVDAALPTSPAIDALFLGATYRGGFLGVIG